MPCEFNSIGVLGRWSEEVVSRVRDLFLTSMPPTELDHLPKLISDSLKNVIAEGRRIGGARLRVDHWSECLPDMLAVRVLYPVLKRSVFLTLLLYSSCW